jgi:hypothetical protein
MILYNIKMKNGLQDPKEITMKYLRSRGKEFWDSTLLVSDLKLPKMPMYPEWVVSNTTNFKIIVPAYNC